MSSQEPSKDHRWLRQLQRSDEKAFEKIYNHFWESLYAVAYNRVQSREVAEEMVQDIFADLWQRRHTLEIKVSLSTYLHAALKYRIFNHFHAQAKRLAYSQDHPRYVNRMDDSTQQLLSFDELDEQLSKGMENLPEKCRIIFKMSREENKTSREIAEELNISSRTAETHIYKALKLLRSHLAEFLSLTILIHF